MSLCGRSSIAVVCFFFLGARDGISAFGRVRQAPTTELYDPRLSLRVFTDGRG